MGLAAAPSNIEAWVMVGTSEARELSASDEMLLTFLGIIAPGL